MRELELENLRKTVVSHCGSTSPRSFCLFVLSNMKGKGKPIGKGHKGQHRRFTNFEEIEAQQKRLAKQAEWRKQKGDDEEDEEESGSDEEESEDVSDEDSEDSSEEDEEAKPKGVESLIEVQNPNRLIKKPAPEVKAGTSSAAKPEMSRREREEAERQRRAATVSLKTEQARADLARLAMIKQQRETARLKREAELKAKEAEKSKTK